MALRYPLTFVILFEWRRGGGELELFPQKIWIAYKIWFHSLTNRKTNRKKEQKKSNRLNGG